MPCLPGYRYCGPGCRGPGAPVNQLDYFCMQHDACYRQSSSRRACDEIFLRRLQPYIHRRDKIGRDAALMYRAISLKQSF
ncbi:Parvovirus coat protein VP1-like protein [Ornithinibacillus sp. L9]|uniref:Parvovirus coat protein VP1-like protein n=1 Tax=Ornithinibacillus caprae TaxID=2678566 RepID=A0A6N8FP31_9BACI|nr:Parvovirus coat protein VP1-like protein [Ornithinibacillus caprae]MUK90334.1 Parvovirus coat protein VP1-like protein [Ornithinibacillus caprae]